MDNIFSSAGNTSRSGLAVQIVHFIDISSALAYLRKSSGRTFRMHSILQLVAERAGADSLAGVKNDIFYRRTLAIIFTIAVDQHYGRCFCECGCSVYIAKPIDNQFANTIRQHAISLPL